MKLSIGTILDFVLLTMLVLICTANFSIHLSSQAARNFHAQALDEIENCNFSQGVIDALKREAADRDYSLTVKTYRINEKKVAEVTLDYAYSIPFLNILNVPQTIRGAAR